MTTFTHNIFWNFSIQELHDGNYSSQEVYDGGFINASELHNNKNGFTINEIKTITAPRLSKVGKINNEAKITSLTSNDFIYIYDKIGVLRAKIPINSIELGTNNKQTITLN